MTTDDEFFRRLERELDFDELAPGTLVAYAGALTVCHGLWVVRVQVDDDRYTLADPANEWRRLNASRTDLSRI